MFTRLILRNPFHVGRAGMTGSFFERGEPDAVVVQPFRADTGPRRPEARPKGLNYERHARPPGLNDERPGSPSPLGDYRPVGADFDKPCTNLHGPALRSGP
jgi:hypothetical protein